MTGSARTGTAGARGLRRRAGFVALSAVMATGGISAAGGAPAAGVPVAGVPAAGAASGAATGLPTSMAALGDSLTRGFNSCGFYVDCTTRSWSTGGDADVNSHRARLRKAGAGIERHRNLAVGGARADALAAQAVAAVAMKADYVTIAIGANDACRSSEAEMTPVAAYRDHVDEALAVLKEGAPGARVFIASVPDVKRLWAVGKSSRLARYVWAKLKVCPSLLARPDSDAKADAARRERVRERVKGYNRELARACAAYGSACTYDGGAVFRERFGLAQVSKWDFFHPNTAGQRALAAVTWKAGFRW